MRRDEYKVAKHLAAHFPERWEPMRNEIWSGSTVIGTMKTDTLATFVCAVHNVFLPLLNRLLMLTRRLKDIETLEVKND